MPLPIVERMWPIARSNEKRICAVDGKNRRHERNVEAMEQIAVVRRRKGSISRAKLATSRVRVISELMRKRDQVEGFCSRERYLQRREGCLRVPGLEIDGGAVDERIDLR